VSLTVGIACYREDATQLRHLLEQLDVDTAERIVLLADEDDEIPDELLLGGVELYRGRYLSERDKRNALLVHCRGRADMPNCDWVLMLDPDEQLVNGQRLRELLAGVPRSLPAFPLLRQEPNGDVWAMPCKLLRSDVTGFAHLDVGVRWPGRWHGGHWSDGELWNLDPWRLGVAVVLAGWPHLVHFRSARADADDQERFYSESPSQPFEPERDYRALIDEPPGAVIVRP
jgi:hypothetical protein